MAVTAVVYGAVVDAAFDKEIDLLADDMRVTLHTSSYTPAQDTHDYANDLTNEVANGNGYTTGGVQIANDTFTYTAGTNTWKWDGDDVSWTSSTITAAYAVISDVTPASASANPLVMYEDFGGNFASTNGTFSVAWHANGIMAAVVT